MFSRLHKTGAHIARMLVLLAFSVGAESAQAATPTSITFSVSPAFSTYHYPVTLKATMTPSTVPGSVTWRASLNGVFRDICVQSGASGSSQCVYQDLPVGTTDLYVCFRPTNTSYSPSCSTDPSGNNKVYSYGVVAAPTTTSIVAAANPTVVGRGTAFNVTVASARDTPNSGTVTISATQSGTSTAECKAAVDAVGKAVCMLRFSSPGTSAIAATYSGSGNWAGSSGTAASEVVNKETSTTTLASSPNPSVAGAGVTFTATVKGYLPGGRVTFERDAAPGGSAGGVKMCTLNIASSSDQVSCYTTLSAAGTYAVSASYEGDANNSASNTRISHTVVTKTYTVTPSAGANGSISPSVMQTVAEGAKANFTVTAQSGYSATVGGSCGGALNGNVFTTSAVNANCTVVASFAANPDNSGKVKLNQFGLSGTWYNPATSGQGFVLSTMPDIVSPGHGVAFAGWFTYDIAPAGGPEKQRWYAVQGSIDNTDPVAALGIYTGAGGNFDALPKITAVKVGTATLQFSDCSHGTLAYHFDDGSGRSGSIPLTRLDANLTCTPSGDNGTSAPTYLLSGVWYKPETSGQGLVFNVNPSGSLLFAAWYTYASDGGNVGGGASQRWYTLQLGDYTPSTLPRAGIPIYTATGGVFDNPVHTLTSQVGSATLTFINCGKARLDYHFSGGSNAGLSGSVDLVKLGNVATQCGL